MSVYSACFLLLAGIAAVVFRLLPAKFRNAWLLLVSAAFVVTWSWKFVIVLAIFALVNYYLGIKVDNPKHQRSWLVTGILINIFFLLFIKYNHFYLPAFQQLLQKIGFSNNTDMFTILVPVGLSFLVVQAISYLLDIFNKRLKPERDTVKFGVYTLYFPKLLSGPVERARLFLPRLDSPLPVNRELVERSLSLLLVGLFRKLALADVLFAMIPEQAFVSPQDYAGQHLFFWLLAYTFALYNDFAGYTSIIRGVSLWFGIELTNNFNLPYLSRNFTEFWNRWHISLSNWLRDYIFFPSQRALMRRFPQRSHILNLVVPPMATLLVSGLWHGLSWSLVVWGALHGFYLVVERLIGLIRPTVAPDDQPWWRQVIGIGITFTLTSLAWLPFKLSLPVAYTWLVSMCDWVKPDFFLFKRYLRADTEVLSWSPLNFPNPLLILVLAAAVGFDLIMNHKGNERELRALPKWLQIILSVLILLVLIFSTFSDASAPFVYQGF